VDYVVEHEGVMFRQAVEMLESRLGLPPLAWTDEDEKGPDPEAELEEIAKTAASYPAERNRFRKFMRTLTNERDLDPPTLITFWEVADRVDYGVAKEDWPEAKAIKLLRDLYQRVLGKLKEAS
jgi:hypothetical protein